MKVFVTYEEERTPDKRDVFIKFKPTGVYAYIPIGDYKSVTFKPSRPTVEYVYVLFSIHESGEKENDGEVYGSWEILGVYDNPFLAEEARQNNQTNDTFYIYTTELKGGKYLPETIVKY